MKPQPLSDQQFADIIEWPHADRRLDMMEREARKALSDRSYQPRISFVKPDPWVSPIILPSQGIGVILGPDGQPIGGSSGQ